MSKKQLWFPLQCLVPKAIYISNSEYRQCVLVPVETSMGYHYIYWVSRCMRVS
ncbi:hypothetical protein K435DRAFT_785989 [Dendrothele bispora CBS 962.96]|uniref:Uncharacterized protein n=1 Tax=Dendrothele bispora (strain CBS 962.96) TaxID=1314807 RepID=A0A4S8KT66_DENBC|nr:hypothetical protein K435DRAFT_785989 [Dendrothele bispora CBS 962.96]